MTKLIAMKTRMLTMTTNNKPYAVRNNSAYRRPISSHTSGSWQHFTLLAVHTCRKYQCMLNQASPVSRRQRHRSRGDITQRDDTDVDNYKAILSRVIWRSPFLNLARFLYSALQSDDSNGQGYLSFSLTSYSHMNLICRLTPFASLLSYRLLLCWHIAAWKYAHLDD